MLSVPSAIGIYLARDPVDFRKSHDGLIGIVREQFGDDPMDGSLFVFVNKRRDRIKLLQWDRDGFWLHYKRLESGTFRIDVSCDEARARVSRAELAILLEGIDLKKQKIRKPFEPGQRIRRQRGRADRQARVAG